MAPYGQSLTIRAGRRGTAAGFGARRRGCTMSRREARSPRGKPRCPTGRQTSSAPAARSYSSGRT
jgi:hypothetical protein